MPSSCQNEKDMSRSGHYQQETKERKETTKRNEADEQHDDSHQADDSASENAMNFKQLLEKQK